MKTLNQLIEEGLPVGALVDTKYTNPLQILYIDKYYCRMYNTGAKLEVSVQLSNSTEYKLTTAYDSNIDPKTLPIPEPFWTGWVAVDRMKDWVKFPVLRYHYSGELLTEIECSDKINTKLSPIGCHPCLPPK